MRNTKSRGKNGRKEDGAIIAYNSKLKMLILASPCILAMLAGVAGMLTGTTPLGGGFGTQAAASFIGGVTAFTLLQMGFDKTPVLIIDESGITCRRPDVGLIPWAAVLGIGVSKATLVRNVLMIAVDENELEGKARRHMRNRVGFFSAFSPQIAKFEGKMTGNPTISIPISYFSIPVRELQELVEQKVIFKGGRGTRV